MKDIFGQIDQFIPATIFNDSIIKTHANALFDIMEEDIKKRVYEILKLLKLDSIYKISYVHTVSLFKIRFYETILNMAEQKCFAQPRKYDMVITITSLLSISNLKEAIMGKPMIDAIKDAILEFSTTQHLFEEINGGKLQELQKIFSETPYVANISNSCKQENLCKECKCSCTCNADCNGDVLKCTSKIAFEKKCSHCCGCFIKRHLPN